MPRPAIFRERTFLRESLLSPLSPGNCSAAAITCRSVRRFSRATKCRAVHHWFEHRCSRGERAGGQEQVAGGHNEEVQERRGDQAAENDEGHWSGDFEACDVATEGERQQRQSSGQRRNEY